jgi:4-amino-4-deoxy-L-arabinose transferase-like glycosyltransferase
VRTPVAVPARAVPATLRASRVVPVALCLLALAAVAIETPRHVSWYLAVDQFGYLSFARDLAAGRLFHAWPPIDGLRALLAMPMDVLVQTYIVDGAYIYSRYSPGYPLLLAGAMALFGTHGAIYLNVAILMGLLAVLFVLGRRLLGDPMAAAAAVGLVLVCPTLVPLWARSPLRDLPAHLAALGGVALVIAAADAGGALRRWLLGGAALGYAMTIRPDAILYLPSAALAAVAVWHGRGTPLAGLARPAGALVAGLVLGLSPLLAYNTAISGNPFAAAQSVEARDFFDGAPTPDREATYRGTSSEPVSGGGLRLGNLPSSLPANVGVLRAAYGDVLLAVAAVGAIAALRARTLLAVVTVPYTVLGLLFFSCWVHADARYLVGVLLCVALLIPAGMRAVCDAVERHARHRAIAVVAGLVAALAVVVVVPGATWLAWGAPAAPARIVAGVAVLAALVWSAIPAARRPSLAPAVLGTVAVLLVAVPLGRALLWHGEPALFREGEMLRARRTLQGLVAPGSVIVTAEDVGRPVENIEFWSDGVHAVYLTDLVRWRTSIADVVAALRTRERATYLLLPPQREVDELLRGLAAEGVPSTLVRAMPASEALAIFVGSPAHRGIPLNLYRLG